MLKLNEFEKLNTPLGEIEIAIDGKPTPYAALKGQPIECLCPHVIGRYQISVAFCPDGITHLISCTFNGNNEYQRGMECGERLSCQGFYSDQRVKLSIGVAWDERIGSNGPISEYDYSVRSLENGMAIVIEETTQTANFTFGIAWIDDVGWDDAEMCEDRDVETCNAADPGLYL